MLQHRKQKLQPTYSTYTTYTSTIYQTLLVKNTAFISNVVRNISVCVAGNSTSCVLLLKSVTWLIKYSNFSFQKICVSLYAFWTFWCVDNNCFSIIEPHAHIYHLERDRRWETVWIFSMTDSCSSAWQSSESANLTRLSAMCRKKTVL